MSFAHRLKLEQLGLSPAEAQVYLAVLIHGPLAAPAIASQTGIARTSVYPTLCSLAEKDLIEGGLGHGSKFTAVAPEEALRALVAREEQTLAERQQIAKELAETLGPLAADAESVFDDSVQLIRTPHLIAERAQRLQLEATRLVELVVKAPVFTPRPSNPAQRKAMERGVHFKVLYERAVMEDPKIARFLQGWIEAGEEARVYDGELLYKMAVFDQETVLLTLPRRSVHATAMATMVVRNAPFAHSMSILFDFFWNQATPLSAENAGSLSKRKSDHPRQTAAGTPNAQTQAMDGNTHLDPLDLLGTRKEKRNKEIKMKQNPASQSRILNPRVLVAFALFFAGVSLALLPGNARGGQIPKDGYVTDGTVNAVVRFGNTIYIGGGFGSVGPRTGPGLEFALDGTQNLGLPEVSGGDLELQAVVSDGFGGWYIAGAFTHVGGVARNNIAHIRADHSVDPAFAPNVNGAVTSLVLSDDGATVYAAGSFTSVGLQPRNHIAALNAANGAVTAFSPNPNGSVVIALARSGSIIYAGGDFSTIGGQARNYIAALNASDGTATLTFNPNSSGQVRALAVSGSTLYVGGSFATIGGKPRNNIAALILGGALDGTATRFNPNSSLFGCSPCGTIFALAVSSSTVYAGGTFDTIGGQSRSNLAGLDPTSGTATAFTPNPDSNIAGLAVSVDGLTVYAGGGFRTIGGQPRNFLAALNATDGSATTFNPNPNGLVASIGVSATAFYAAGFYSSIGGVVRHSLAALNASTGKATSFAPDSSYAGSGEGLVNALAVSVDGSTIYVGGFFTSFGGQPRNFIAALNAADGTATAWNPGIGTDYAVTCLALSDSVIYVGGYFQFIGGQPRQCLAAIGLSDGLATAFDANIFDIGASVEAVAVSGSLVYAGGDFLHAGGQSRMSLGALNAADGSATAWDANLAWTAGVPQVHAITISGSTIYVGGYFSSVGSQSRLNIAAINAADGTATPFNPQASGTFASDSVDSIALSGSKVYAGGRFQTIGGQSRNYLAGLNASDGSATSFNPGAAGGTSVFALAVAPDGTLYAGGDFHTFERAASQSFAAFANHH